MKQLFTVLLASMLLSACGSGDSDNDISSRSDSVNETHRVCKFSDDDADDDHSKELTSNVAIDEAEMWVMIDSMAEAGPDIDIKSLPEDEQFAAAFAAMAFAEPSISDLFTPFYVLYACTEATYTLNQCNWEIPSGEGGTLKVETQIGSDQSYTATVSTREDAASSLQQTVVLQGTIGDLGNITLNIYEDSVSVGSREATRTDDGTETVRWTSADTNWVATETSNCSGSLEYEKVKDTDTITLNAQWSFDGTNTSGALDYQKVGTTSSSVSLDW